MFWLITKLKKRIKKMKTEFTCDICGQIKTNKSTISTGYGLTQDNKKACYNCCADIDRADKYFEWQERNFQAFKEKYPDTEKSATEIEFDENGSIWAHFENGSPLQFTGFEKWQED
jgi:flagellar hook protein FlgE